MKTFTHPKTGREFPVSDTCEHYIIYDSLPLKVGQVVTGEKFKLVNGVWVYDREIKFTVDEGDLIKDALLD